jgi:hypothetical protein
LGVVPAAEEPGVEGVGEPAGGESVADGGYGLQLSRCAEVVIAMTRCLLAVWWGRNAS